MERRGSLSIHRAPSLTLACVLEGFALMGTIWKGLGHDESGSRGCFFYSFLGVGVDFVLMSNWNHENILDVPNHFV